VWQLCKEKSEGEHFMTAKQWAAALMVVSGLSGMMTAQAGWWSGGERDWKQQLRGDGKELYDAITRVHPGIYDERNRNSSAV
jgi:hypothetical protein